MLTSDPREWSYWIWCLHVLGALYVGGFVFFYFMFRHEERLARKGGQEELEQYNLRLRGFPNAFFAKMLGKRPFKPQSDGQVPAKTDPPEDEALPGRP